MVPVKQFCYVGALMMGLGFFAVAFSGGCSSGSDVPVQTAEQKAAEQKEIEEQTSANDAASKSGGAGAKKRGLVMPP